MKSGSLIFSVILFITLAQAVDAFCQTNPGNEKNEVYYYRVSDSAKTEFYFKAGLGYSFDVGGDPYRSAEMRFGSLYSESVEFHSNGAGMGYNLAFGCNFQNNIGLELEINYLQSNKINWQIKETSSSAPKLLTQFTKKATVLTLEPAFVVRSQTMLNRFTLYARLSALFSFPKFSEDACYFSSRGDTVISFESDKKLTIGAGASIGVTVGLGSKISCYCELKSNLLSYKPTSLTITRASIAGQDMRNMLLNQVISLVETRSATLSASQLQWAESFNSVGIRAGVQILI